MSPFEALKQDVEALTRRLERYEERQKDPLLPAHISSLAADYQSLIDICNAHSVSPHLPAHRPWICKTLRSKGWTVIRIAKIVGIGDKHVRQHLKKPDPEDKDTMTS